MKEEIFMSQVVKVLLHSPEEEKDVLSFFVDEEIPLDVNLNSETCQNELKEVFIQLFALQIEDDVHLELEVDNQYQRGLYREVCTEYIKDLDNELMGVRRTILEELK